jgi:hypothetical protein
LSDSIPLTGPRQVVPWYGTTIESVPIVALPVNLIAQEVRPGAAAFPSALHAMAPEEVKDPCALPVSFKSFAQVALNEPLAEVAV